MNAQAGPSRPLPSRTIDLASIPYDKSRIVSSLSSTSIAPSLSTHRSSTQSAFSTDGWGGLHTPRSERLSLAFSESSIVEDDVLTFGQGRSGEDRSIDSVMLGDAQLVGLWLDLDKTPKPSDPIFKAPQFPSRLSSLPRKQPFHIPPDQASNPLHLSPEQRSKPLPVSPQARLDKPLPLFRSPQLRKDKALPPAPFIEETGELPPALPDDSPLIPACMLARYVPPLHLIPVYDPDAARKKRALLETAKTLAVRPVPRPNSMTTSEPGTIEPAAIGPPPPIPPRRSSRKERSGQSIPTDQKIVPSTSLTSLGSSTDTKTNSSTSLVSLEPVPEKKAVSSTSLVSLGQAPPLPPPRASSLRSKAARSAIALAASAFTSTSAPEPAVKEVRPQIEAIQSPLTRRPRVRSRSAQLPPTTKSTMSDRQTSKSFVSLSSILEDEALPDMEATPDGSWSLRRKRLILARSKSQPKLRRREEYGPWRPLRVIPSRCISPDLF